MESNSANDTMSSRRFDCHMRFGVEEAGAVRSNTVEVYFLVRAYDMSTTAGYSWIVNM